MHDTGTRLLVLNLGHGLNEELEVEMECTLCSAECESVKHVLWECLAYIIIVAQS